MARFLLLFVDGVGLAPAAASNPLATVPMPALAALLGGALTSERIGAVGPGGARLGALDAALGVEGLPQSATGQTALFTGVNAPARVGRHVAAFPGPRLAAILEAASVLRRVREAGLAATFANPFTPAYFAEVAARRRRHSATTLAALAGGGELRGLDDLRAGRACTFDVTRDRFAALQRGLEPAVTPVAADAAGADLARLAAEHELTLWETFLTDLAGHGRRGVTAHEALTRLDGLLAGIVRERAGDLTVLLTSDHGNLEESSHGRHTRNPVPLLAFGPEASAFADLDRIDQIAPRILARLGAR